LYRVMRALASIGVFNEVSPRTFTLTPLGELLRAGVPGTLKEMILWWNDRLHFETYAEM